MKHWVEAARLRTLPLALSSIILGGFLAHASGQFSWPIFGLGCLTTILLQVLSNFANDYGDTQNGADAAGRIGPQRAVQSGAITPGQMWRAILLTAALAFAAGLALLYVAFQGTNSGQFLLFVGLGILSIGAAYKYTAGRNPYGYAGLGDLSVFFFFGLIGVIGSLYLYTKTFEPTSILPAMSIGFFSTGVLNVNNIRDIESDTRAGKRTIPSRLGRTTAVQYHWFLLLGGMASALLFTFLTPAHRYWYVLVFPLILLHGKKVSQLPNPDSQLKQLALTTLLFAIAFGLSFY